MNPSIITFKDKSISLQVWMVNPQVCKITGNLPTKSAWSGKLCFGGPTYDTAIFSQNFYALEQAMIELIPPDGPTSCPALEHPAAENQDI
jgi:hypothetical protein